MGYGLWVMGYGFWISVPFRSVVELISYTYNCATCDECIQIVYGYFDKTYSLKVSNATRSNGKQNDQFLNRLCSINAERNRLGHNNTGRGAFR